MPKRAAASYVRMLAETEPCAQMALPKPLLSSSLSRFLSRMPKAGSAGKPPKEGLGAHSSQGSKDLADALGRKLGMVNDDRAVDERHGDLCGAARELHERSEPDQVQRLRQATPSRAVSRSPMRLPSRPRKAERSRGRSSPRTYRSVRSNPAPPPSCRSDLLDGATWASAPRRPPTCQPSDEDRLSHRVEQVHRPDHSASDKDHVDHSQSEGREQGRCTHLV
jgi:hypothetical protein